MVLASKKNCLLLLAMLKFPGLWYSCWEFAVMVICTLDCPQTVELYIKQVTNKKRKQFQLAWGTAYIFMALHELCQLTTFIIHPNNPHSSLCSVMQLYLQCRIHTK